jgi:uncharacterized protein (TIGR02271 family)
MQNPNPNLKPSSFRRKAALLTSIVAGGAMLSFAGCRDRGDDRLTDTTTTTEARQDVAYSTYPTADRTTDTAATTATQTTEGRATGATGTAQTQAGQREADIVLHEETLDVQKREVDAGGVVVRKDVVTEEVEQPVELRRERVEIAHVDPAEADVRAQEGEAFQEDEIYIPLRREEAVVQRDVQAREALDIQRHTDVEQEQVQGTVRREVADVQRQPGEARTDVAQQDQFAQQQGQQQQQQGQFAAAGQMDQAQGQDLEQRIRQELRNSQELALSNEQIEQIDINVDNNNVTLSGNVPNEQVAQQIELRVSQIQGVQMVENDLQPEDAGAVAE